jgi:hypothetical protein
MMGALSSNSEGNGVGLEEGHQAGAGASGAHRRKQPALPRAAIWRPRGARQGSRALTRGPARSYSVLLLFQIFFKLIRSKGCPLLIKKFQIEYGHVYNWIRNKLSHGSFSKFGTGFELKFRELNGVKFDWLWILGTRKLWILIEFDMWDSNHI